MVSCTVQVQVQCCFTSKEIVRTIRDGEPRTAILDFHTAPELRVALLFASGFNGCFLDTYRHCDVPSSLKQQSAKYTSCLIRTGGAPMRLLNIVVLAVADGLFGALGRELVISPPPPPPALPRFPGP